MITFDCHVVIIIRALSTPAVTNTDYLDALVGGPLWVVYKSWLKVDEFVL